MALVVLGAVLLIVGTAARYLRNEVATRDVFADHAVEALEEEASGSPSSRRSWRLS